MIKGKIQQNNESDVYVKIDFSEALEAKKQFLEMMASLINLQMTIGSVKELGKKEMRYRSNSKRETKSTIALIGKITEELPKVKAQKPEIKQEIHPMESLPAIMTPSKPAKDKKKKKEKPKRHTLGDELTDIKRKLASLG